MSRYFLWLGLVMFSGRVSATENNTYVPSSKQLILSQVDLLISCQDLLKGYKECVYHFPQNGLLGDYAVEAHYRGSAETGIYVDRQFSRIGGDIRIALGEVEIPIPDGEGVFFVPFPMPADQMYTIRLVNHFSGYQTFDRGANAIIRSVTLVKSNSHYIQQIVSKLPELKQEVEAAKQRYLALKRHLRLLSLTKDSATVYLTSVLGRDQTDLSGDCTQPFLLEPEECSVLAIIVGLLKGDTPGITINDKQLAFADFARRTTEFGRALTTLQSAQREYSDNYRQAYGDAFNLVIQETPQ